MSENAYDIIWDIDGVLSDFTFGFKTFVNTRHHIPVAPCGAKKSWQFRGLARMEEDEIWRAIAAGKYDWSAQPSLLAPVDKYAMNALRFATGLDKPVRFHYITSRLGPPSQVEAQTRQWLKDEMLPDYENVVVSGDKVTTANEMGLQVAACIDDDIRNVVAYGLEFGNDVTYIRDWQYNRYAEVNVVYGLTSPEAAASWFAKRVSSVVEFCYAALESIDGIDRG